MIFGKNLIIYEGTPAVAVAACRSCTIVNKADVQEDSSPDSEQDRTYKVGRISWEITISSFVTVMKDYVLRKGQTYFLTWKDRTNTSDVMSGSAICTNVQIQATQGTLAQGTLQFIGLDDISPAVPAPVPQEGADFNDDYNNDFDTV